ncbi:hypothetical protein AYK21_04995 [Thermoplasmatales archaeon SG8-52-2]|nr:MAG: hypothetical protein AYK21_04995 [Thermoplasmatales archaeon SG8-52-2]
MINHIRKNKIIGIIILGILLTSVFSVSSKSSTLTFSEKNEKTHLSFAAFSDTHIGAKYEYPRFIMANHLDKIGDDLVENTNLLDFAIHLGDIINHNTGQVNGVGLPFFVNQYKNNLKAYLIDHLNLPFHCILGNHDLVDYKKNPDNPYNLTKSLIDELSMNNPIYAMMRDGILFLIVPTLGFIQWTHPVIYEWIEFMTKTYKNRTTVILCHQAIEDTTREDSNEPYRGKQDMEFWANLFKNNPQIKMWINGHNHMLDWYVGDRSTGCSHDVYDFGHEMVFSAPYSQLDWGFYHEEDRIVIYNISSSKITTTSWENNGRGGHFVSEYINSWNVQTTFNPDTPDWYSFPMFLQDNETQITDQKVLSPNITLQLIGTKPMELFYDSKMESPSSKPHVQEVILGFGNDRCGNVEWNNPGMIAHGKTFVTFPEKHHYPKKKLQEDGRSGQPYHFFPMGTICAAIPGQTYEFKISARTLSGNGTIKLSVNCSDWNTKSQYSILSDSEKQVISHKFGQDLETVTGTYTVPKDKEAWFLQGRLEFLDSTDYEVTLFSVKRKQSSSSTKDFHLFLSSKWYNLSVSLIEDNFVNYSINPENLTDESGVINFNSHIDGNCYGMVNLIFHEPILLCRNARFKVKSVNDNIFNLSLTKTISRISPEKMVIWNSELFEKYPFITELFSRFLTIGLSGKIFNLILNNETSEFKIIPFSTDSFYKNINITVEDGSGKKYTSSNGNIWLSCNSPKNKEYFIEIFLPSN